MLSWSKIGSGVIGSTGLACLGAAVLSLTTVGTGCERALTFAEFRAALEESVLQGEAQAMANDVIEISTSFTIGQAVAEVRDEIRAFAESQIPCSTVTTTGEADLIIDFGELGDSCTYNGRTYAGVVTISLALVGDEVIVTHSYEAFRNERIQLDGVVDVTWGGGARQVVSDLEFEGEGSDGELRTLTVQADRTMTFLDPALGLAGGINIAGTRDWQGQSGDWHLDIDNVEIRGADPVPQGGAYVLTVPSLKTVTLSFERLDEDTIEVTITGPRRSRVYEVTSTGAIEDGDQP
jgi:hypothetical protein